MTTGSEDLVQKCGGRCHVFDNKYWNKNQDEDPNSQDKVYRNNQYQLQQLLQTIDRTVEENGGVYTNEMLQKVHEKIQEEAKERVLGFLKRHKGLIIGVAVGAFIGGLAVGLFVGWVLVLRKRGRKYQPLESSDEKKDLSSSEEQVKCYVDDVQLLFEQCQKVKAQYLSLSLSRQWFHLQYCCPVTQRRKCASYDRRT
ncbi:hypothetical protein WMY93_033970 [Mugilogobius chulae]|uniref:Uncharacterized protein n=1 Tax=Mugilogobius chulae TaxID=88201 RepID=A0AAW0MRB2_9GOBI